MNVTRFGFLISETLFNYELDYIDKNMIYFNYPKYLYLR